MRRTFGSCIKIIGGNTGIKMFILLMIIITCTGFAAAQDNGVEISGYYEPQFTGFKIGEDFLQLTSNKLRIDLERSISDRITFKANYDFITYNGQTTFFITDYLVEDITSALPPGSRENYIINFANREFLDNAYLKIAFNRFDLTVGKQQVSPGTGYAWNPTDIFNTKNVLDPTYEQPGQNAVRADIPIGSSSNLMLLYSPENDPQHSGKFIRYKATLGHFDISVLGGERYWSLSDFNTFVFRQERRRITGMDIAGELFGIGVWSEWAYNNMEISEDFLEGLIGFDYTFESGLYMLNEFYHNEQGKSDHNNYGLNDWIRNFYAETRALSRDQWYSYLSYPATDLLNIGASAIASLNDGSFAIVPMAIYNFDDNLDFTIFGNFYSGSEGKTYSSLLGNGLLIRARYYF
ncbi:MAG: hypothetical protein GY863_10290 [bacterium]|nr:hypothetical protein [bacterium]